MEALEDKAELDIPERCGFAVLERGYILPVDVETSCTRLVQKSDDVEKCGLTASGRSHDADKFAFGDIEIDIFKSLCLDLSCPVNF